MPASSNYTLGEGLLLAHVVPFAFPPSGGQAWQSRVADGVQPLWLLGRAPLSSFMIFTGDSG